MHWWDDLKGCRPWNKVWRVIHWNLGEDENNDEKAICTFLSSLRTPQKECGNGRKEKLKESD